VEPDHDVDPRLVTLAIESKLPSRRRSPSGLGEDPTQLLERRAGERVPCRLTICFASATTIAKDRRFMRLS